MLDLPMEVITMALSTIGGAYMRMKADERQDLAEERRFRAGAVESARAMQTPNVSHMRKVIVFLAFGMAYLILLAPLFNLPTMVPIEVTSGFKFLFFDFTNTVTEYVKLEGMVTPPYLSHVIVMIIGFYFGINAVKR